MASATAIHQPFRIVSRRAQLLLQKHRNGGQSPAVGGASKKSKPKEDETPWPKSLRYTFYTACVVAVPLSIGQAIALSPRLRDWMLGDDVEGNSSSNSSAGSGGFSSREIISLVRNFWGHEDFVAPVDRPQLKHVTPGHRKEWQDDNYSSLLELFGLYTPKESSATSEESVVPMSLDYEPPSNIRNDQTILSQYLSTKTNPSGVKARLSLIPCKNDIMEDDITDTAGYETECTLPGNASLGTLRALCQGSDAQSMRRDLAESDPNFVSQSTNERIRTKSWNEDCRWVVSFADSGEEDGANAAMGSTAYGDIAQITVLGSGTSFDDSQPSEKASDVLRHNTAVNSSWTYFPHSAENTPAASLSSPLGSVGSVSGAAAPSNTTSPTMTSASDESIEVLRLEHQISTLEAELKDPSSLRDRDGMYEELKLAKRELKSLKPWWRRVW